VQADGAVQTDLAVQADGTAPAAPAGHAARVPEPSRWVATAVRHWNVDRSDPRDTETLIRPNPDLIRPR
jgi:hypothetical protein